MPDLSSRHRHSRPAGGCRRAPARYVRSICSPRSSRAAPGSPRSAARARRAPPRRAHRQFRLIEGTCWPAPIASSTRRPRDRSTGCPLSTGSATRLSASCGRRAVGAHLWSMSFSWIVSHVDLWRTWVDTEGSIPAYPDGRFRRVAPFGARSGEGPLSEPTAVSQPWPGELVFMPLSRHSSPPAATVSSQAESCRSFPGSICPRCAIALNRCAIVS